jgi:hypothetical protein
MRVLICGAGRIVVEVLKRLGPKWQITIVDIDSERVNTLAEELQDNRTFKVGDASSSVVLDRAGLKDQDYVLAMTGDDRVNLAVAAYARANKVRHVLSLVHDGDQLPAFHDLDVRTIDLNSLLARTMVHYLQNPRVGVTPLSGGNGELFEIDVGVTFMAVGRRVKDINTEKWRVVGIFRNRNLVFPQPDSLVQEKDRLLILGQPDLFQEMCTLLECGRPRFPQAYGQRIALALPGQSAVRSRTFLEETLHMSHILGLESVSVLSGSRHGNIQEQPAEQPGLPKIEAQKCSGRIEEALPKTCTERTAGLAVIPGVQPSGLDFIRPPRLIRLAHNLPCPLLVSRGSQPYTNILVSFNGSPESVLALETGCDLAGHTGAELTIIFVQEPEFLYQDEGHEYASSQEVLNEARQLAHIHKVAMQEILCTGNVVREISAKSKQYDLLILGSRSPEREFLRPHAGELLVRRAECSVLLTVLGQIPPPAGNEEVLHGV